MNPDRTPKTRSVWPTLRVKIARRRKVGDISILILKLAEAQSPWGTCYSIHRTKQYKMSATAEIARDGANPGHSRSLKDMRCCANRRRIYYFSLALDNNLTLVFNRSWDITPSLYRLVYNLIKVHRFQDKMGESSSRDNAKRRPAWGGCALTTWPPKLWTWIHQ